MNKPLEKELGSMVGVIVQILTITFLTGVFYTRSVQLEKTVADNQAATEKRLEEIQRATNRLEHYVQSNDPDYWKKVTQNGDGGEP